MSVINVCRLCSSEMNLVWVFHKKFGNPDSMKNLIYITTGVEIQDTDSVSQKICEKCCHVTINIFQFRKNSLENDRLLKERMKNLKNEDAKIGIQKKDDVELVINPTTNELPQPHPYPHLKLPRICLRTNEVEEYLKNQKWDSEEQCRLTATQKPTARKRTFTSVISRSLIDGKIISQDANQDVLPPIKMKITSKTIEEEPIRYKRKCHRKRKWFDTSDESSTSEDDTPDIHEDELLRCKFCRFNFQSVKIKEEHSESECPIKKMITGSFPTIILSRIETNSEVVKKYPEAFSKPAKPPPRDQAEVIEILSDDEEDVPKTKPPTKATNVLEIKPDVTLKGDSSLTEVVGPKFNELDALKNLLNRSQPPKTLVEKNVQTEPPDHREVQVNASNQKAVFEGLKWQLNIFRVPVVIQNGPFGVVFKNPHPPKTKNVQLWDKLTAVDVREGNKTKIAATTAPICQTKSRASTPKEAQTASEVKSRPIVAENVRAVVSGAEMTTARSLAAFPSSGKGTTESQPYRRSWKEASVEAVAPKLVYSTCPVPRNTRIVASSASTAPVNVPIAVQSNAPITGIAAPPTISLRAVRPVRFKVPHLQKKVHVNPNNVFENARQNKGTPSNQLQSKRQTFHTVPTYRLVPPSVVSTQTTSTTLQSSSMTYWPSTSANPINLYQSVNTNGTFWPAATTSVSSVAYNVPTPHSTNTNPNRIRESYRPDPPPYPQHLNPTSHPSNIRNFTRPCQSNNVVSFSNPNLQSALLNLHVPTSLVNSNSYKLNVKHVTPSNQYQSGQVTSVAPSGCPANPAPSPQLGHIRVKNMRELT